MELWHGAGGRAAAVNGFYSGRKAGGGAGLGPEPDVGVGPRGRLRGLCPAGLGAPSEGVPPAQRAQGERPDPGLPAL